MKGILGLFRRNRPAAAHPDDERIDSMLFTTAFDEQGANANPMVTWEARALEVGATALNPDAGTRVLQGLWAKDKFMLVLLSGRVTIERLQPGGVRRRLAEATAGEMLGEMSLLDSGIRFSACSSSSACDIAVLSADALDQMLQADPALAANLIALLARKLSLRMRAISARLNDPK